MNNYFEPLPSILFAIAKQVNLNPTHRTLDSWEYREMYQSNRYNEEFANEPALKKPFTLDEKTTLHQLDNRVLAIYKASSSNRNQYYDNDLLRLHEAIQRYKKL